MPMITTGRHLKGQKCAAWKEGDEETKNEYHVSCPTCVMAIIDKRVKERDMQS